jgi:hypothetical protein
MSLATAHRSNAPASRASGVDNLIASPCSGPEDSTLMRYEDDPAEYKRQLEAKLSPTNIRATLAFAGLYQLTHEQIKRTVLDDVKGFFGFSPLGDGTWLYGESGCQDYESSVLALAPKRPFAASLLWLKEMNAITADQMEQLDAIYAHRHSLTHDLGRYLVDINAERGGVRRPVGRRGRRNPPLGHARSHPPR